MKRILSLLMVLVLFGCSENKKDYNKMLTSDSEELKTESISMKTIRTRIDNPDSSIEIFDKSGELIVVMQNEVTPDHYWDKLVIDRDEDKNEVEYRLYRKWKKYYNSKNENYNDLFVTEYNNEYDSIGNLIKQTSIMNLRDTSITNYTYDSLNQISDRTIIDYIYSIGDGTGRRPNGGFRANQVFASGRLIRQVEYWIKGDTIHNYNYLYEPKEKLLLFQRNWEYICEYDSDGKELLCVSRGKKGKIHYKDSTFYNDKGEKTYTLQYYKDDILRKTTYEYYE